MRISAISDVHVKTPKDQASDLLCTFLNHHLVKNSDFIILLGDIFDLMCGPHEQYFEQFNYLFDLMDQHQIQGRKVLYFEGNHDVHLTRLFHQRWPLGQIIPSQIPQVLNINSKTYYFSHGDEHEVDNLAYQRYKSFIISPPLKFVANFLMPYQVLHGLGRLASKQSRKRGAKTYQEDKVRERFREGVQISTQGKYDFVLGGHSHVKDQFKLSSGGLYLNNGYALKSQSFIYIENHQPNFISI